MPQPPNTAKQHPHLSTADLADIHGQMLAFAKNQLADTALAEDAVQDTLIKTITHHASFKGKSAYKSWVFSILKNTIIDMLRKQQKTITASSMGADEDENDDALFDTLFKKNGHWHKTQRPTSWHTPDESYENHEFWQVLEVCLTNLPAEQSRVFMMREYIGLETPEICDECNISTNKFYVLMHRARIKLQSCLSVNWFEHQQQEGDYA